MGNINVDGKDYIIGVVGNVEPAIEWQDDEVCFADGQQWVVNKESNNLQYPLSNANSDASAAFDYVLRCDDFQPNTIKQGDYIASSELDNKKYNDAVEVFGLFGFEFQDCGVSSYSNLNNGDSLVCCDDGLWQSSSDRWNKRKLTFNQLMIIGELKRLEIERDKEPQFGKNEDGSMKLVKSNFSENPNSCEDVVNKPSHYQFFEGVEVIEIIASSMTREQFKGYCLGNRIKYRLRAGNKDKLEQEIAKSDKYVELYDEHKHLCK